MVEVRELGKYTVNIICWPRVKTKDDWSVNRVVTRSGKERLDEAGFIYPYPRRIIQVTGDAAPTANQCNLNQGVGPGSPNKCSGAGVAPGIQAGRVLAIKRPLR